jgi:alkanesulfonate monooxygenase SsuD/methylene tetrahydromethanopterin reductase-like flavin-dependent oxidoreductase (luciferase family)
VATKVIIQVHPSIGDPSRHPERRPIGRDNELYQQMLASLERLALALDDMGYWGLSHTEHHFHSEGLELSPDPGLYNLYLGRKTKRLHHGQLGYVLPTRDPIRLAETCSMLDHMLGGRFFVGLARGYQRRWVDVLGQRMNAAASSRNDQDADDRNRQLFSEHFRLLKAAWTDDLLQYKGEFYEVPFPYDVGIRDWPPADFTRRYGVPGEVDHDGTVVGVSVVPRPFQRPHPPLFQANSTSAKTVAWAARNGVIPTMLVTPDDTVLRLARGYREAAAEAGYEYAPGQNTGIVRTIHICRDRTELAEMTDRFNKAIWGDWYQSFGFLEGMRRPDETGPVPGPGESVGQRLLDSGLIIGGTLDDVKRRLEAIVEAGIEYFVWHLPWGLVDDDALLDQLELFAAEVMPAFDLAVNSDLDRGSAVWHDDVVLSR